MHVSPSQFRRVKGLALAGVLAVSSTAFAQTAAPKPAAPAAAPAAAAPSKGAAERFTGMAANLPTVAGETITIDLIRWSTDAERDKVVGAKDDKERLATLQASPNLGYIWRSGSGFGSFIRYAVKFKDAGGEHTVLVTDADLSAWKGAAAATPTFTLLELAPAAGLTVGKLSVGGKVTVDAANKTLKLDGFAAAPVAIRAVKHQKGV